MVSNHSEKTQFSRRRFIQLMAGASLTSMGGTIPAVQAWAKTAPKRTIRLPKFKVRSSKKTAAERYQCKPELKRFASENMAFKVISEELGTSSAKAMVANLIRNIKSGKIGHGVAVEDAIEARMFFALNVAATTWNNFIGPYGENRENKGFLSWLPQGLPPDLTAEPLPLKDTEEVTRKIKVIAAYAGADNAGVTVIDRRWVFDTACLNGLDPGAPQTKAIVFQKVDQPMETEKEFVLPDSVRYAVVTISVQPRAVSQIGPASLATIASTNQGYSQGGLSAVALAQAIRSLGYVAIPCMNSTALSVPLAIDAGLGQLGRLGYLITPEWGPHVRIDKVLTNLPLEPDSSISFGVTEYCTECGLCAVECPSGAISPDKERSFAPPPSAGRCGNPGALKWYIDGKKCLNWWIESGAAGCTRCMDVCPYTYATLGDGFDGKTPDPATFWELEANAYGRRSITY